MALRKRLAERARVEESDRAAAIEQAVADRLSAEMARAEAAKKADIAKAVKDAVKVAETKLKLVREAQAGAVAAALEQERRKAAKKLDDALGAEKTKHFEERQRLETALNELRRKVQVRQHPVDVGTPLEAALLTAISSAFSENICVALPVPRGRAGPDITVRMLHEGEAVGLVVVEAKAVTRWSSGFVTKAKSDSRSLSAMFTIIATTTMPKDTRGLTVIDGVIICEEHLVVPLLVHLRDQLVTLHRLRVTAEVRDERAVALLGFLGSSRCESLIREFGRVGERLHALDQRERSAHESLWNRRAELIKASQDAHREFTSALTAIMNGNDVAEGEIAA